MRRALEHEISQCSVRKNLKGYLVKQDLDEDDCGHRVEFNYVIMGKLDAEPELRNRIFLVKNLNLIIFQIFFSKWS